MKYKLLCCEVFLRMACLAISNTSNIIDPEFMNLGAHESPDVLNKVLQNRINEIDKENKYDAILLGYGLCGNSTVGLTARSIPLVIPRAHDCCTIFLGSREKFLEYFKDNLSSSWGSAGYMERDSGYLRDTDTGKLLGLDREYSNLVEQYGEENAEFIWQTLHPQHESNELIYIDVPEITHLGYLDKMKTLAAEQEKNLRVLDGDMRLIRRLIDGDWNEEEYLIVKPGETIKAVYDHEKIMSV